jgi:hypothetical protein
MASSFGRAPIGFDDALPAAFIDAVSLLIGSGVKALITCDVRS